jgi:OOP family OmpA-OmpF porin
MSKQPTLKVLGSLLAAASAMGCTHTMAFSDTQVIAVVGHPPPPPPAPEPPPPPPPPQPPPPPKPEPQRVEVQNDQIVIHEKIQFDTDRATIRPASNGLMEEITQVIASNPQLHKISIEGHTDDVGNDKRNQQLSEERAIAVRKYLVQHGIALERLTVKGWGETKPIADNSTAEGREQNRRVEFIIVEQGVKHVEVDPSTGQPRQPTPAGGKP